MPTPISEQARKLWEYGTRDIRKRIEREWASLPNASLEQKLWGPLSEKLLPDHKRQHVSQLGGVAKSGEKR